MAERPSYSIIAPVYNEAGNLQPFYQEVRKALESTREPWELIMVNDGSNDGSMAIMLELAAADQRVKVINFARNFGHQIAVTAGVDFATGAAVVLIDADRQDPPSVIPRLIDEWKRGYDVVYAIRGSRKGESLFKRASAKLFYRLLHRITDINIPVDTGDFRLMDAKVAAVLRQMREHHRFVRGMTSWVGFRQTGIEYVRDERIWGRNQISLAQDDRFCPGCDYQLFVFPFADHGVY